MAKDYYVEVYNGIVGYCYSTSLWCDKKGAKATAKNIVRDLQRAYPDLTLYEDDQADDKPYAISVVVYETRKLDCDIDIKFYALVK